MHRAILLILVAGFSDVVVADDLTFEADVHPILKAHCFQCHGEAGEREGELDLRVATADCKGGRIWCSDRRRRCSSQSAAGTCSQWAKCRLAISGSARKRSTSWPIGLRPGRRPLVMNRNVVGDGPIFTQAERNFWAFQPVQRPSGPTFDEGRRVRTPIDALLLQANSESGEIPANFASDAVRTRLIRRGYFDLIGLPPSPDAVSAFVADDSSNAWGEVGR